MPDRIERLSAYVDGDLDDHQMAAVEHELESSPSMREIVDELRQMKALARGPVETAPDRWRNIEQKLRSRRRPKRWAIRLGVAAAVAATIVLFLVARPEPATRTTELARQLAAARVAYVGAIDRLAAESSKSSERLPPEARARLAESLRVVDRAIAETESMLKQLPDDPFGHETLLALYEEKVRILNAAIDASSLGGAS